MAWERITAAELKPGDRFASTRNPDDLVTVVGFGAEGESARYIKLAEGGRIRPRYTTRFWRVAD